MDFEKFNIFKDVPLPDYVVADVKNLAASENTTIRKKAAPISFPLSKEDTRDIYFLVSKFKKEKEIAGLAAPQIGISKRVFVFEVPDIYENEKTFPFSIWINPSFEKVNDITDIELEECFSVKGVTAPVERWRSVYYKAYDLDGKVIEGSTDGVSARIIQHETDHLDGKLFIDYVPKEYLMSSADMHELAKNNRSLFLDRLKQIKKLGKQK